MTTIFEPEYLIARAALVQPSTATGPALMKDLAAMFDRFAAFREAFPESLGDPMFPEWKQETFGHVLALPESDHSSDVWPFMRPLPTPELAAGCGTQACLAGWTCVMAQVSTIGMTSATIAPIEKGSIAGAFSEVTEESIPDTAGRLLGLTSSQAEDLFRGGWMPMYEAFDDDEDTDPMGWPVNDNAPATLRAVAAHLRVLAMAIEDHPLIEVDVDDPTSLA